MKKWLIGIASAIAVVALAGYAFRAPLMNAMFERMTAHMFVAKDDDAYDPGIARGERLPPLHARYAGKDVTDASSLMGAKGLALYVNRSVDW